MCHVLFVVLQYIYIFIYIVFIYYIVWIPFYFLGNWGSYTVFYLLGFGVQSPL